MGGVHQKFRYGTYELRQSPMLALPYLLLLTARPVWCQGTPPEIEGEELTPMTNASDILYAY